MPLLRSMTIWFAQKNQKSSIPNGTRNAEGSLKQQAQIRATGCTANELRTGSGSHAVSHFFTKPAANAVFVRQPETNKGECHRCGWWATIWGWHWWMRGWALVGGELSWERSSSIYRLQALSLEQHPPPPKKKRKISRERIRTANCRCRCTKHHPHSIHPTNLCTTAFFAHPSLHRQLKAKQDKNRAKRKEQTAMAAAMATKLKHKQCKEKTQNAWPGHHFE